MPGSEFWSKFASGLFSYPANSELTAKEASSSINMALGPDAKNAGYYVEIP